MLNTDLPIEKIEDDKLSRGGFAKELATAIINRNTPNGFVVGMYGEWGSGKTSVVNMVIEQLEQMNTAESQKPIIMRFNPWLCADQKQLVSQFFKQLSTTIKDSEVEHLERHRLDNICGSMNDYAELFELGAMLPKVGGFIKVLGKLRAKKASEYNNNIQMIKDKIAKNLRECQLRLLVTIDDIDRLSNAEIMSVFQVVKSLADFPYTTYLLAFDRDIVVRALGDVQKYDGAKYLEKIVQTPFELPAANSDDIYNIFFAKMNEILGDISDDKWDKHYWSDLFYYGLKYYLTTIRNVERYINTFSLKYAMVRDEVCPIDLIGLTFLQVFELNVFATLPMHKDVLCGTGYGGTRDYEKEKTEAAWSSIISCASESKKDYVKKIILAIFPKLNRILSNGFSSQQRSVSWQQMRLTNSIAHSDSFNRYFTLNLESEAIPTSHLNWIVSDASEIDLTEAIRKINTEKKSTKLLDYIHVAFDSNGIDLIKSDRAKVVFECLCKILHELDDNEDMTFFAISFDLRFVRCIEALLSKLSEDNKCEVLGDIFNNQDVALPTLAIILRKLGEAHNRYFDSVRDVASQLLSIESITTLEKIFFERTVKEMGGGAVIEGYDWSIMFLIEKIEEEKSKTEIIKMITTEHGLINLINSSVGTGKVSSRETLRYFKVSIESLEKHITSNVAYERIKKISASKNFMGLDLKSKQNIVAFLAHMEKNEPADGYYEDRDMIMANVVDEKIKEIEKTLHEQTSR
ncbi:MAG: KAP family NTPase [Defluviitaleaceae bacterium]|nr:KAP family NTPase [Defluviitaleaceae bacterium]